MLSQLMVVFGFFALVLVAVYWVNKAVALFDRLISDGHSIPVVMEFTVLSLPAVIAQVLPLASFAAAVYVTNRLTSDSEMTVVQATGYSPWRLGRPVLLFGIIVALMMSVLTHLLVPKSLEQLRVREKALSGSVSARLLRDGVFLHPVKGVTFYIRDITPEGELRDVVLSDRRMTGRDVIYSSEKAYLLRDDGGPKLVMLSGMAQTMDLETRRLSTTNFNDLVYDVSELVTAAPPTRRRLNYMSTAELITDPVASAAESKDRPGEALEEGHLRFQLALLVLIAPLIGYSALMVGGFSRFGVTRQIVFAIVLLVLTKMVESLVSDPVRGDPKLWPMVYLPSLVGLTIVAVLLWQASRVHRPRRRQPPAQESAA
ncbi:LPS export ABC transporter permease LptF [Mameliella sediminis]|uniref:LPS export ABC transporter permease LptF n=1 Tax=Mameliella sediminis TaxID=2836866 RepID=UPI001C495105|nr:LPS export ABC transporter permease LptF [Mameliella sediminis]MBY6161001.1 LPS export ABC transporter permease LptF [Mameliella alba]MBY6169471.1 LPS export ABC transporter permease LptF [Mameliella alba]MBY6174490.1 LPS export ABC transporter permease LptF [Mameliella alba]